MNTWIVFDYSKRARLPNRDGGYLDLHAWRRRVRRPACAAVGVKASPYSGRHSYASLLIHEGRSLPFVSASMGHSSPTTTLEHYIHAFEAARHGTAVRWSTRSSRPGGVCARRAQPASRADSAKPRRAPRTA